MNISKTLHILFVSLAVVTFANSCTTDDFLDQEPKDAYSTFSVFTSENDMIMASNHLYSLLPHLDQRYGESRLWLWTDDGWRRNAGREGSDLNWLSDDAFLNFYHFEEVRDCNEFISRIADVTFSSDALSERLIAEARFVRAMLYERMVFVHGDVPLVTETQDLDFFPSKTARLEVFDFVINDLTEISEILPEQYENEDEGRITKWAALALLARANLNAVGWHPSTEKLYDDAEAACQEILTNSGLSLDSGVEGFRRLFTHHSDVGGSSPSNAVILSRNYIDVELPSGEIAVKCLPQGSYIGTGESADQNQAQYGATWNLVQAFQTINGLAPADDSEYDETDPFVNRDPRLTGSLILPGDQLQSLEGGGTGLYSFQPHPDLATVKEDQGDNNKGMDTGYLIRKYSGLSVDDNVTQEYTNLYLAHADFKVIRLAEVILMMAEALAADNNPEALDYINQVRERVGMPGYGSVSDVPTNLMNGTTGEILLDAVLLERRYEFAGEAPFRMLDIWRYRLGDQVYGIVEGMPVDAALPGDLTGPRTTFANTTRLWDEKFYLLPLPQSALDLNPNLKNNNPGW
ncbi:MAG: RagB/SusD family nutrient uptake outer membrane protein [Reichenbachiella sp.]|uniref:RagB/SusD family nutrient uptake outer membrane protein n=1 Tax=Reichenbachiella sp. TaxID=2184521 RepID=UPI003265D961